MTIKTSGELIDDIISDITTNLNGDISGQDLRVILSDTIESIPSIALSGGGISEDTVHGFVPSGVAFTSGDGDSLSNNGNFLFNSGVPQLYISSTGSSEPSLVIDGRSRLDAIYSEPVQTPDNTSVFNLDLSESSYFMITMNNNKTLSISNPKVGQRFMVRTHQEIGGYYLTWFSNIKWPNSTVPSQTTTINKGDMYGFVAVSGDSSSTFYDGYIVGQNL